MREELLFAASNRHYFDLGNQDSVAVNGHVCIRGELEGALAALWSYRATTGLEGVHFSIDKARLILLIELDHALDGLVQKGFLINVGTDIYGRGPYLPTEKEYEWEECVVAKNQ